NHFNIKKVYEQHIKYCNPDNPTTTECVKRKIYFNNIQHTQNIGISIVADFESRFSYDLNTNIEENKDKVKNELQLTDNIVKSTNFKSTNSTEYISKHIPYSYCYHVSIN